MGKRTLKFKAFIYRFSNIFGLNIYLAKKEEQEYIDSQPDNEHFPQGVVVGMWQAMNGFTTVCTYKNPWYKALWRKTKHAFDFRRWE